MSLSEKSLKAGVKVHVCVLVTCLQLVELGAGQIHPVALTGQPVPQLVFRRSAEYSDIHRAFSVGDSGSCVFVARMKGEEVDADDDTVTMIRLVSGVTYPVGEEGDTTPLVKTSTPLSLVEYGDFADLYDSNPFNRPLVGTRGRILMADRVRSTGVTASTDFAVFGGDPVDLHTVFQEGDVATGTDSTFVESSWSPDTWNGYYFLNDDADVVIGYRGQTLDAAVGSDMGIWVMLPDGTRKWTVEPVVMVDDLVPGTAERFNISDGTWPSLGKNGVMVIPSRTRTTLRSGIWIKRPGESLETIVFEGDVAPLTGGRSAVFSSINTFASFDGITSVAFFGEIQGEAIDLSNNKGVWIWNGEEMKLIARSGEAAAGLQDPSVLYDKFERIVVSRDGSVLFCANLSGGGVIGDNDYGIWSWKNGVTRKVLRDGDILTYPDGESGPVKSGKIDVNNKGEVAMFAVCDIGGGSTRSSYWVEEFGQFVVVCSIGDTFEFTPGDEWKISNFRTPGFFQRPSSGSDGLGGVWNSRREFFFIADFENGEKGLLFADMSPRQEISISELANDQLEISWSVPAAVLQEKGAFDQQWQDSSDQSNPQTIPLSEGTRFFRTKMD